MTRIDGLEPGQELAADEHSTPRQAATIILLRGGARTLEVLLVQRSPAARLLGGAWVFPGGVVDPEDGSGPDAHRRAAVRELEEETGVTGLKPADLALFSRWITPSAVRSRYDTHFFLARLPEGARPRIDGKECADLGWFAPAEALARHRAGGFLIVFPTIKHLEPLTAYASADAALEEAGRREVVPVQPRLIKRDGEHHILLPGDPGYGAD
jgi:8-oxo-dGTP pyrophosphatase MutT (NUDIX family)